MLTPGRALRRGLTALTEDENGSTLLLYPFAVLIVFAIGAIAVDAAVLFQAHRQAVDVAAGIASDAAGLLDEAAFAADGTIAVDRERAAGLLAYANGVELADHPHDLRCTAQVRDDPAAVEVTCTGAGRPLLLPITGGPDGFTFSASSRASPVERG